MPSFEHVTYNSSRVQRAFRINNIEELKLKGKIHLLDKERIHRQRITNQDIRLISVTLDYIQANSGHSSEALAPDTDEEEIEKKSDGPCFLYGERIISRKKRRNLRPQSAFDQFGTPHDSDTASTASTGLTTPRPQSSPVRKRPTFITSLRDDVSESGYLSVHSKSGTTTPQPAWAEAEPSEITKRLLRANTIDHSERQSVFNRDKNVSAFKALTRNLRISSSLVSQDQSNNLQRVSRSSLGNVSPSAGRRPSIRRASRASHGDIADVSGKRTSVHDVLNQNRPTLSASAWKSHLNRGQGGPINSSMQRQFVMDSKKDVNRSKSAIIQSRIREFINS